MTSPGQAPCTRGLIDLVLSWVPVLKPRSSHCAQGQPAEQGTRVLEREGPILYLGPSRPQSIFYCDLDPA